MVRKNAQLNPCTKVESTEKRLFTILAWIWAHQKKEEKSNEIAAKRIKAEKKQEEILEKKKERERFLIQKI